MSKLTILLFLGFFIFFMILICLFIGNTNIVILPAYILGRIVEKIEVEYKISRNS